MALWQYQFFVIPRESVKDYPDFKKVEVDDEFFFDDSLFWKPLNFTSTFFSEIESILPKSKSWDKDLIVFGNLESNTLQVLCEEDIVTSVSFRIDYMSNFENILNELIDFFLAKDLTVLDENLNIVSLEIEAIKEIIYHSPQFKKYKEFLN
ncbi:hypothetical protein LEP1GSC036_2302 [Leptospira weilii str. 2006001853]|uniref:Uncharacterized protein n=2 Tax=Leptospira weilii TaxID=28184 RepID=A0A828YXU4_9LEPT|nr:MULTISPECIES: hypothetical protein [Leptospira]EKR62725.1 hypothetical protein LEP1GSC036_2302 [Leptospira weilii str. 2006001853]EMN89597.1 hypothetical protein LEP1GSC108_3776 [Leptospira weilii str. UI 13098]MDL5247555.1 hypothetical protein [Leptospira weilii]OMI16080.1 hypothetical protein BUQ74_17420 [Leptospira weilii serovar Heyan]UPY80926.1 hypothetical protein FH581_017415 [Leptospira weilii]